MEGGAGDYVICYEKSENHKNSTNFRIKFYIIFIYIFFSTIHIKILTYGAARLAGMGRAGALSIQKNKKITRTVLILKSYSR